MGGRERETAVSSMIRRVERNTRGRDIICGDVHGCFDKLRLSLRRIGFDPAEGDRLFAVGDLVDRGPESADVLKWLSRPWFHSIMGNHEQMAMMFAAGDIDPLTYSMNGGDWLIDMDEAQRAEYIAAFMGLPLAIELETPPGLVCLVHANCAAPTWDDFKAGLDGDDGLGAMQAAVWDRGRVDHVDLSEVGGVRAIVVGHTPLEYAQWFGNVLHIDTGAWLKQGRGPENFALVDAATLMLLDSAAPKIDWSEALA